MFRKKGKTMKGWKTWTGFVTMIASIILRVLGHTDAASIAEIVGGSGMALGIAHKIEKAGANQ